MVLPSELVTCVVLTAMVVNGVLPSVGVKIGMVVTSGVLGDELTWVELVTGVLVSTEGVETVLPSELVTRLVLTGIIVNGVLRTVGVEICMVVTSAVVGKVLTWVEMVTGVLVSTGRVEGVLGSEMVTDVVLTGIIVNGVLPSLRVETGILLA